MVVTVVTVVATHYLSKGVFAVIILSAIFFVAKISKVHVKISSNSSNQETVYDIKGQLFFASVQDFVKSFSFSDQQKEKVTLNFAEAHIWDDSAVAAIDKVVLKLKENNKDVLLTGLNDASKKLIKKLATYDQPNAKASGH